MIITNGSKMPKKLFSVDVVFNKTSSYNEKSKQLIINFYQWFNDKNEFQDFKKTIFPNLKSKKVLSNSDWFASLNDQESVDKLEMLSDILSNSNDFVVHITVGQNSKTQFTYSFYLINKEDVLSHNYKRLILSPYAWFNDNGNHIKYVYIDLTKNTVVQSFQLIKNENFKYLGYIDESKKQTLKNFTFNNSSPDIVSIDNPYEFLEIHNENNKKSTRLLINIKRKSHNIHNTEYLMSFFVDNDFLNKIKNLPAGIYPVKLFNKISNSNEIKVTKTHFIVSLDRILNKIERNYYISDSLKDFDGFEHFNSYN